MRVVGRTERRFERRWWAYCALLEQGTDPTIGHKTPAPSDRRREIREILSSDGVGSADRKLNEIWNEDSPFWRRRLQPFLERLPKVETRHFGGLVREGCQPDALALQFHRASQPLELAKQEGWIRKEVLELDRLRALFQQSAEAFVVRRREFDRRLLDERLSASHGGEPDFSSVARHAVYDDLTDELDRQADEFRRLRRWADGRREPLLGHAYVQLGLHIQDVTGRFQDDRVVGILKELGAVDLTVFALKKQRARWQKRISGVA